MKKLICYFWLLVSAFSASAQTVYGVTGLIKTPTAYTLPSGEAFLGYSNYDDRFRHEYGTTEFNQWSAYAGVGFLSFFEAGIRIVGVPDVKISSPTIKYGYYIDRMINLKFAILREKKNRPQLAIGFQDVIGTRIFNSTYFAVSKKVKLQEKVGIMVTLGYGTKFTKLIFSDPDNYRFIGPFGGTELNLYDRVHLMFEYDTQQFNTGLRITPCKWLNISGFVTDFKHVGGTAALRFGL
jgi:hypothetical protein